MARGRPPGQMTQRRRQVLEAYANRAMAGERLSLAEVARRCGLYDYRNVRRIVRELQQLGAM